jgi:TRAP-type C4-dicarboxylate transport system substrate-binding protein
MKRLASLLLALVLCTVLATAAFAGGEKEKAGSAAPIKLVGATQLPDTYVFYKTLVFFRDKLKEYYKGPLEIDLHHSAAVGTEKDYIEYMIQGTAVDFAISAPSWAATFDKRVSFLDPPFLYRDIAHWEKVLATGDAFKPIYDDLLKKGLRILGYGGGGTRNLILRKPVTNMQEASTVLLRVMASPIQTKIFGAVGMRPTPLDYMEVYNAIKTGVIDGLENESASLMSMKFYEVAPNIIQTQHAITVRPLWMSEKSFQKLPKDLQEIVLRAGKEATKFHRDTETKDDANALKEMAAKGMIKVIPFDTREMQRLATPVLMDYARELGAEDIMKAVQAVK